ALPDLARRGGASRATRVHSRQDAERELKAAKALGVAFVALGEPNYPPRLQMIDDAPPLLAVRGQAAVLHLPAVAVVGARHASAAGLRFARPLAREPPPRHPCRAARGPRPLLPRRTTPRCPPPPGRRALWSGKCRRPPRPARAFPPAATGSFPGCAPASWWWRRPSARALAFDNAWLSG